jgi:hypothetical protein
LAAAHSGPVAGPSSSSTPLAPAPHILNYAELAAAYAALPPLQRNRPTFTVSLLLLYLSWSLLIELYIRFLLLLLALLLLFPLLLLAPLLLLLLSLSSSLLLLLLSQFFLLLTWLPYMLHFLLSILL